MADSPDVATLPEGTVAFLFTDLEAVSASS
jgi:hypothetical protein